MKKLYFIVLFVCSTVSYALQGGPTQPDYIEFEPYEMKDMVSLVSGNFAYSIPLSEVPGPYGSYPLSISYHAGISPQKEASWVGLGWTLSPGSILRDVRGVPDDQFHGGTLGFIYQYSALYTWDANFAYSNGAFSVGVNASSINGSGVSATLGPKIGDYAGIGFTVSTNQGYGVKGYVGFEEGQYGLNVSAMYSPRSGRWTFGAGGYYNGLDLGASVGVQYTTGGDIAAYVGMSDGGENPIIGASVRKNGVAKSLGPVTVDVANSATKGGSNYSSTGFSIVIPAYVGVFSLGFNQSLYEYHMKSATSDYVYGYMYQGGPAIIVDGNNNIEEIPDAKTDFDENDKSDGWKWTFKGRTMETLGKDKMQPAYDMFTVESEGVSGTFRAFPREEQKMFNLVSNYYTEKKEIVEFYNPILELDGEKDRQPHEKDFFYDAKNQRQNSDYRYYKATPSLDAPFANYKTNFRNEGNRMVYRKNKDSEAPLVSGMNFLFLGEGGYYESEEFEEEGKPGNAAKYNSGEVSKILLKRTLNKNKNDERQYALYGSRKVEPIFEDDSPVGKIKGFVITNSNGTKYFFTQPVKSYLKVDYSINQEKGTPIFVDRSNSVETGSWSNFKKGMWALHWPPKLLDGIHKGVTGKLDEKCNDDSSDETMLYSYQVNMNPHATQWLLTEIQGPDYIQLNENDMSQNIGYNVKFHYTKPILYQWRSPFAQPHAYWADLPNFRIPRNGLTPEGCDTKMYQAAFGVKEYVYLESIETATHWAGFEMNNPETEERVDGKGWFFDRKDKDGEKTLPILTTAAISLNVKSEKNNSVDHIYINDDNAILGINISSPKYHIEKRRTNKLENWYEVEYEYDALFVNVEIPELLLENLKKNPELFLESDYFKRLIHIDNNNSILFTSNGFKFEANNNSIQMIEKTTGEECKYGLYKIKLKKGDGVKFFWHAEDKSLLNEVMNGNVKLVLGQNGMSYIKGERYNKLTQCAFSEYPGSCKDFPGASESCYSLCSEKNDLPSPLLDWSDIVFVENRENPTMNQMRYLKKISYYNKKNGNPYREYNFEYDYSLQPKTLNSYCKSRYPRFLSNIQDSPLDANLDICTTDKQSQHLYGKLTLRSISEKGCQNGRCSSLPPFKFDYNVASQSTTRYSEKNAWKEKSQQNTPQKQKNPVYINSSSSDNYSSSSSSSKKQFFSEDYYDYITDVDASIIATTNSIDEWGFWNIHGNENNHKVSQSFADYGGAAWSMNKITDPAGGVMEIKYERDVYKNGEDHGNERLYAPILRFGKCSKLIQDYEFTSSINPEFNDKSCALFLPMYWHDQCLGPYDAYWSFLPPKGNEYDNRKYDYMDSLGIVKDGQINKTQTVFFSLHTELSTQVKCGVSIPIIVTFWGRFNIDFDCDRYRKVGVLGSSNVKAKYDGKMKIDVATGDYPYDLLKVILDNYIYKTGKTELDARLLVFEKDYEMIEAGVQKAADKINDDLIWDYIYVEGSMWAKKEYKSIKGGDIRVKSLVRYDVDRSAKTEYEYDSGEMAQLPDSAYTTVMANGYNVDSWSYTLPDLNMNPKSRIVGFDDDDLLYVPGASVMYPKVTVKNSEYKEENIESNDIISNGKTEFEYITPEKGIPKEYIDPETQKSLRPFIRVNANFMTWGGKDKDKDYINRPCVITFAFYDYNGRQIGNSMNVLLQQNHTTSFSIYDDNIKNLSEIRLTYQYYDDKEPKNEPKTESMETISVGTLTDFNEIMLTISHIKNIWKAYLNWSRSQEVGYYPILYKEITYSNDDEIELDKVEDGKDVIKEQKISPHFEKKIIYHDFTAFLGMNTKISTYRGNDDKAILLKVDSSVYSTRVPDVLDGVAEGTDIAGKIGKQVERWNSKRELQCVENDKDCRRVQMSLSVRNSNTFTIKEGSYKNKDLTYYQDNVSFEYKRYPVFQIASITNNGFDNQEKQFDKSSSSSYSSLNSSGSLSSCDDRCLRNQNRMHWNMIENHKYDPVTSNPTATLAKIPAKDGGEIRKLTVKLPHHAVINNEGKSTKLADFMFQKNMLSQNYADFVYFDSKSVNSSTSWNDLEKVEYLKSFSMNPLNKYNGNLAYSNGTLVEHSKYPYVEWGAFTTKSDPAKILKNENPYTFVAGYQDIELTSSSANWPSKHDFSGIHILQVDRYFRPLETEDILNRKVSAHYSDDGLYQTGIFYPTERSKTAAIIPVGDDISEVNVSNSLKNSLKVDLNKGGMTVLSSIHLSCSIFHCGDTTLVAEYRVKKFGQNWQTERKNISEMDLTLSNGDILNYLRIYPENAEAKTFIYDRYGNIVQIVNENNLSTFYEYNPLGQLIQTRNDDGVTFKSHHREFVNDNKNEIPWSESVYSSSSSGF